MRLLKWKAPSHVTVDFYVTDDDTLLLSDGESPGQEKLLNPCDEWRKEIVEASWDSVRCGWVVIMVRTDKPFRANARETWIDTKLVIGQAITADMLAHELRRIV